MNTFKAWLHAARLRTLPLSLSGIVMGTALANSFGYSSQHLFILALLTTIAFQITSNFANDYGDGVRGTDDDTRVGPTRALQGGMLTAKGIKRGIYVASSISLLLAAALIYTAFGQEELGYVFLFFLLAAFSVWAAIRYTNGKTPYGYMGLGDVFVFLFFGLLGVLGSLFLYTKTFSIYTVLPAMAIGFLCVGVLNLNNLRDIESDKQHGKITVAVRLGFSNGKRYHYCLLLASFLCMLCYTLITKNYRTAFYFVAYILITIHLLKVMRTTEPKLLDGELKKLALSTFLMSLLFYIAVNYFS